MTEKLRDKAHDMFMRDRISYLYVSDPYMAPVTLQEVESLVRGALLRGHSQRDMVAWVQKALSILHNLGVVEAECGPHEAAEFVARVARSIKEAGRKVYKSRWVWYLPEVEGSK